jgi:DUF1680 family protein
VEFSVRLRIPGWLEKPAVVAVNGRAVRVKAEPGSFAEVTRRWRKGETIELELPFTSRTAAIEDRARNTVASMRGPVMLVAVDPPDELTASAASLAQMEAVPGKPLEFDCLTGTGRVRMRPFYQVQREAYSTYFRQTAV